jgi:hypothetical protein
VEAVNVHFTPTSASWINQVERFFANLTDKQIRRGVHRSTTDLEAAITACIDTVNANPKPSSGPSPPTTSWQASNGSASPRSKPPKSNPNHSNFGIGTLVVRSATRDDGSKLSVMNPKPASWGRLNPNTAQLMGCACQGRVETPYRDIQVNTPSTARPEKPTSERLRRLVRKRRRQFWCNGKPTSATE